MPEQLLNYVAGSWRAPVATAYLDVHDPATGESLACVPLSTPAEVDLAATAAGRLCC